MQVFTLVLLSVTAATAQADLVYDAEPVVIQQQAPQQVVVSAPAQVQQAPAIIQAAPQFQVAPQAQVVQSAPVGLQSEGTTLSRSELLRRERMRKEMQYEDVLQSRIEALRLREEERRTNAILKEETSGYQQPVIVSQSAPVLASGPAGVSISPVSIVDSGSSDDEFKFGVSPRGGLANMVGNGYFNILPYYSVGGALTAYSGQFAFDLGYTYNQYGVSFMSTNPYIQTLQMQYSQFRNNPVDLKQNVIDAAIRLYLLRSEAKFRPFAGAGFGYSRSFINYSQGVQNALSQWGTNIFGQDYQLDQYLGSLAGGADLKLGNNFSISLIGKYYFVFSARETQPIYGYGAGYSPYGGYANYGQDLDKMIVSNGLSQTNFYSLQLGVNIIF